MREKFLSSRRAFRGGNNAVFPALILFIHNFSFSLIALFSQKIQLMPDVVVVVVVTEPVPRDRGVAEDHGAPEAGRFPRAWTGGRKETESRQRVSGAKNP